MNRFVRAAAAALVTAGGLGAAGCHHTGQGGCPPGGRGGAGGGATCDLRYRNWVDQEWPERYNFAARQAVLGPFAQQVANGHLIHQTVWNWYFEPGTDKLNPAGMEKLDSLARTPGGPDPKIFLQAARDVTVTPENVDQVVGQRDELTARRAAAVMKYLTTQPGAAVPYEIAVHDAPTAGIYSPFAENAFRGQLFGYVGGLNAGGVGVQGVAGGASLIGPGGGAPAGAGVGAGAAGAGARGPGGF